MHTITLNGGNLFAIAALYLNDATQWIRIAQLNSLDDTQFGGITTILIPDLQPSATGGVITQ